MKSTQLRGLVLNVRKQARLAHLILPIPPSVNNLTATVLASKTTPGGGRKTVPRRVKTKAYEGWLAEALAEISMQQVPYVSGEVRISASVPRPNGRRDLDNTIKAILDALVKGYVIEDDNRVCEIHFMWGALPKCSIYVEKEETEYGTSEGC